MLQQRLDNVAQQLTIGYSNGDNADAVTGKVTLPYRAGSANRYEVTWESSSDQVKISGYGWSDYAGAVTRTASDRQVTLTATVKLLSNAAALALALRAPMPSTSRSRATRTRLPPKRPLCKRRLMPASRTIT